MNIEMYKSLYKDLVHPDCLEFVECLGNPDKLEQFYEKKLLFIRKLVTNLYYEYNSSICNTNITYMDLYQEACLSFFEQMSKFNPYRGISVLTYTYLGCKYSVLNYLSKMLHNFDLNYRQYKKLHDEYLLNETCNISNFNNYLAKKISYEVETFKSNSPQEVELYYSLVEILSILSDIEKKILVKRLGLYGPSMSMNEICQELSIKSSEAYSIYNKAITKLRSMLCMRSYTNC